MDNNTFKNLKNIAIVALPLLMLSLLKKDEGFKLNMNLSNNYEDKAKMLREIKPYFLQEDQHILGKVQDIFEILNMIKRIIENDYNDKVKSSNLNLSIIDRKGKILSEMVNYLGDNNKTMAESIVNTKNNILKAKENLKGYSQLASTQNLDRLTSMVKLANCIEPILPDKGKVQSRKLQQIVNIMKASDESFRPLY
ncbi:hypothetical protein SAMN05660462_01379 [Proteiniborus ethanoligenes]|uniref:Uncharacterized protein n=1 Tax=Proteiniborus ethanoligenes TaxID=415015 RepID=A0A1H3P716_9FIRM|nr:hypothetical protein [Proteiniborus ethanoligenes]TAH61570.1 MAG: hypothetical protein EWM50_05895 [Gottschalkiaceae bacterium]SDY96840.1 hypothetical protein SAMN05660462_01379 [Proteiniborus ethanoligenes]